MRRMMDIKIDKHKKLNLNEHLITTIEKAFKALLNVEVS